MEIQKKNSEVKKKKILTAGNIFKICLSLIAIVLILSIGSIKSFPNSQVSFFINKILDPDLSSAMQEAIEVSENTTITKDDLTGKIIYKEKDNSLNFTLLVNL